MNEAYQWSNEAVWHNILYEKHFKKEHYGFKKVTDTHTHWVIIFKSMQVRFYAYKSADEDMNLSYDTNIMDNVKVNEFSTFVTVFLRNYN